MESSIRENSRLNLDVKHKILIAQGRTSHTTGGPCSQRQFRSATAQEGVHPLAFFVKGWGLSSENCDRSLATQLTMVTKAKSPASENGEAGGRRIT